jgi:UDP-N-acetylglucosamine 2-epimerase
MYDATLYAAERARGNAQGILDRLGVVPGRYLLATVHRASNTDNASNLARIVAALSASGEPVVFPVHPRTRKAMEAAGVRPGGNVLAVEPVSYLEMLTLEEHARKILTDSGGVQKEALWFRVPCITLREETEWVETVECGWNTLVGTEPGRILAAISAPRPSGVPPQIYGDGHAAERIANILKEES